MNSIEQHIFKNWNDLSENKIYVAASGGLDSTFLAYTLKALKFDITVLHVNYQLRGEDSEKDAQFIASFCNKHSIPFHSKTINLSAELKEGGNLQELARNTRYEWFNEFLKDDSTAYVALAHHKNDQVETFLLNLSRKSGVIGLAAMLERNGRFIRPLLTFSKDEVKKSALERNLNWREDKSNASNKYRRNFLRNSLIPILDYHIPSLEKSILILIKQFQNKQIELENKVNNLVDGIKKTSRIQLADFLSLDLFEQIELIRQLDQSAIKATELIHLSTLENGKKLILNQNTENFSSIIKQNEYFLFEHSDKVQSRVSLKTEIIDSLPETFSKNEIYLDSNKIIGSLVLRKWKTGDRIKPIGMSGSKLISDVIKDAKVSALEKSEVLVVSDDLCIHWCVGLLIGRNAIANNTSTEIMKVYLTSSHE